MSRSTRRLWLWLPAAFLVAFSVLVLLGAEGTGSKVFYGVVASVATVGLLRSWRARIDITERGVTIHGLRRTRRFPWEVLRGAKAEPMRTASPFQSRWPYVALNGALTVAGLAAEAGVSRSTANRSASAVKALRSLQLARGSEDDLDRCPFDERQARNEIAELRRRHAEKVGALELSIDTLVQHVQVLALDNERLRHALAKAGRNVAVHGTAKGGA